MKDTKNVDDKIKKIAVQHALWRKGNLKWLLMDHQKPLYDYISDDKEKINVILSARQVGKSYILFVHAVEYALKNPKSNILYVAPTRQMCREIIRDKMSKVFETCPDDLRADWYERDFAIVFKNGSRIALTGTEQGSGNRIRGRSLSKVYFDESSFARDLNDLIRSILMPTLSTTGGNIIMATTPPKSKNHDMIGYIRDAQQKNKLKVVTIYDNPMVSEEMLQSIIKSCGGEDSDEFRREYLAEIIVDAESLIVPEFTPTLENDTTLELPTRPPYCDTYVSMDYGFKDGTACLFAYYDFKKMQVVIEDEIFLQGETTDIIADAIKYKESELWTDEMGEKKEPLKRVSDTNLLLIADLERLYDLQFEPTKKDNKDAAINEMRVMIQNRQVIIHPRCNNLLFELRNGEWTTSGKDFKRLPNGSHCDTLMALVYLLRSIDYDKNPFPTAKVTYDSNKFYRGGYSKSISSIEDNPFKAALARQFGKKK